MNYSSINQFKPKEKKTLPCILPVLGTFLCVHIHCLNFLYLPIWAQMGVTLAPITQSPWLCILLDQVKLWFPAKSPSSVIFLGFLHMCSSRFLRIGILAQCSEHGLPSYCCPYSTVLHWHWSLQMALLVLLGVAAAVTLGVRTLWGASTALIVFLAPGQHRPCLWPLLGHLHLTRLTGHT